MLKWLGQHLKIKKADIKVIEKYNKKPWVVKQLVSLYEKGDCELYRMMLFTKPVAQSLIFYNLDDKRFADGETICYLSDLFVHPKFRKKGIGTRMMLEMKRITESKGFSSIILGVNPEHEDTIRLYKKLGYTKECGMCDYNIAIKDENNNRIKQKKYLLLSNEK